MSKPEAARYRTTNWKSYNDALRRRGSLLIWLDKDMGWLADRAGRPGRPPVFSDAAIQFCLMVKVLFGLPLRQSTGMVASILEMAGLAGAGLLHLEPQAEDPFCADPPTPRARLSEPAGRQ